jgi:hypothetical protein
MVWVWGRAQFGQKHRTEPIVMSLARGKTEPHRQSVGVNHHVDFAGQSASRSAHVLLMIFRDARSMLVTRTTDVSIICMAAS